jgi:hypothetical protein
MALGWSPAGHEPAVPRGPRLTRGGGRQMRKGWRAMAGTAAARESVTDSGRGVHAMSGIGRRVRVAGTSPASPHRERHEPRQRMRHLGRIGVYAAAEQAP